MSMKSNVCRHKRRSREYNAEELRAACVELLKRARGQKIKAHEDQVPKGYLSVREIARNTGKAMPSVARSLKGSGVPYKVLKRFAGNNVRRVRYYKVM